MSKTEGDGRVAVIPICGTASDEETAGVVMTERQAQPDGRECTRNPYVVDVQQRFPCEVERQGQGFGFQLRLNTLMAQDRLRCSSDHIHLQPLGRRLQYSQTRC